MITPLGMQSCGNCQDKCEVGRCFAGRGWCCDGAEERPTTGAVVWGIRPLSKLVLRPKFYRLVKASLLPPQTTNPNPLGVC